MNEHIQALIKKAADANDSTEALEYATAAAHCASAVATMAHAGQHLS